MVGIKFDNDGLLIPLSEINSVLGFIILLMIIVGCVCYYFGMLPNNVNKDNCKITIRDYKWLVVILIIIIVFLTAMYWGGDKDFADKIAFSGTLSSIILSVLAIIMTLLSEAKNDEIKSLINVAANEIRKSVKSLQIIEKRMPVDRLDKILSRIESLEKRTKHVEGLIEKKVNFPIDDKKIYTTFNK